MKKTITILLIFLTFGTLKATEPEEAFCLNKVLNQDLQIADMWLIYTHNLDGNQISGQFLKYGVSLSLEENSLTEEQIKEFITSYGEKFRIGSGNYFLLKQNNSLFIYPVNRTDKGLISEIKNLNEVITSQDFIYIMIPKKEST